MKTNIIICAGKECLGDMLDLPRIKQYFENNGHEVFIHDNFCREINSLQFNSPFTEPERPTVFAGCSPLGMESRIKLLFNAPLEIANIREQCAWSCTDRETANRRCRMVITSAVEQVPYTPVFKPPANVLAEKLAEYNTAIDKMGPNPFKA